MLAAGAAGAALVVVAGVALAFGGDDAPVRSPGAAPQASVAASPSASSAVVEPSAQEGLSPAVVAATSADRTASDARAALEEQLAARADANLALLRNTWAGDQSAAAQAAQALATSSSGLSAVVDAWAGPELATRVRAGLDDQSQASEAYAAAVARGDVAAADVARARMGEISRGLGAVLDGATDGRIAAYVPPQDAAQYRAFVDALQAQDAAAAQEASEWLRARLGREGVALATGLSGGGQS